MPNPNAWAIVAGTGARPPARYGHSAVLVRAGSSDPESILVFGGLGAGDAPLADTHRLIITDATTARWEPVAVSGALPPGRANHLAFWDAPRQRMLIVGGSGLVGGRSRSDVWELRVR